MRILPAVFLIAFCDAIENKSENADADDDFVNTFGVDLKLPALDNLFSAADLNTFNASAVCSFKYIKQPMALLKAANFSTTLWSDRFTALSEGDLMVIALGIVKNFNSKSFTIFYFIFKF